MWTDLLWLMPPDRTVTIAVTDGRVAVELGPDPEVPARRSARDPFAPTLPRFAIGPVPLAGTGAFAFKPAEDAAMPDSSPGLDDMPLHDMPAAPAPDRGPGQALIRKTADRRRLQRRFLRAGREAVDDRDLLELLLSGRPPVDDAGALARALLDTFGTAPRALAARPDRLRTVPGLPEDAIAALKAAEALAIRMARAEMPDTLRPSLAGYDRVIEYCRTLAGHREVEQFHILYLNRNNLLIADERLQKGSVCHTPVYPREVCIRCLELQASGVIAVHNHPSGNPEPSRADIAMTDRLRNALKTIEVTLLDHLIVTPTGSVSFHERGLL